MIFESIYADLFHNFKKKILFNVWGSSYTVE